MSTSNKKNNARVDDSSNTKNDTTTVATTTTPLSSTTTTPNNKLSFYDDIENLKKLCNFLRSDDGPTVREALLMDKRVVYVKGASTIYIYIYGLCVAVFVLCHNESRKKESKCTPMHTIFEKQKKGMTVKDISTVPFS
jgi:hypothetical protein